MYRIVDDADANTHLDDDGLEVMILHPSFLEDVLYLVP
jgi:hypothetical protein